MKKVVVAAAVLGSLVVAAVSLAAAGSLTYLDSFGGILTESTTASEASADGKSVYLSAYADNTIRVYDRNASTGVLDFVEDNTDDGGMSGPEAIAVSRDGANVYVAAQLSDTLHVYSRNETTGAINIEETETDDEGAVDFMEGTYDVEVSPDGKNVYAVGADEDGIVVFGRNQSNGLINFIEAEHDGAGGIQFMNEPRALEISPDGKNVYVSAHGDANIVVFNRNQQTGVLTRNEEQFGDPGILGPQELDVTPDGKYLVVAQNEGNAVLVYKRAADGSLTFQDSIADSATELGSTIDVVANPTGEIVYAVAANAGIVVTLSLTGNGNIGPVENDGDSLTEMGVADSVMLTPDGRDVYVTGSDYLNLFSVQPELTLKGRRKQDAGKLAVKAEVSADCRVTLTGRGLKRTGKNVDAGDVKKFRLRFKGDKPSGGNVTVKGKAECGGRSDGDRLKVGLK